MKNKTKLASLGLVAVIFLGLLTTSAGNSIPLIPVFPLIPLLTPQQPSLTLSRSLMSDGRTYDVGYYTVGDQTTNTQVKCFLSFDISSIPAGANITSASLLLTDNTITLGNPFQTLGYLRVHNVDYGNSLTLSDFNGPRISTVWAGTSPPNEAIDVRLQLQNAVATGKNNLQFRIEFTAPTDNDNKVDRLTFNNPGLLYFYTAPEPTPQNKPDFRITSIQKTSGDAVSVTITNSGAGSYVGQLGLKVWFNDVVKYDGTGNVNMPAGSTTTINLPSLVLPPGLTTVKAMVDPYNLIPEENEANNERTQFMAVDTSPPLIQNMPPVANAGPNKTGVVGQPVTFDGTGSTDQDGTIISYAWQFGDGRSSMGSIVSHVYTAPGTYTVSLTVTDNHGATNTDTATAIITQTPSSPTTTNKPPIADAGNDKRAKVGETIIFDASDSIDPDGTIVEYSWDFGDERSSNEKRAAHSYAIPGVFKVTLVVTDNDGATDRAVIYATVHEEESPTPPRPLPGFGFTGVLGAAALVYYYYRRKNQ